MDFTTLIKEKTKKEIEQRENLKEKCPYFPCHTNINKEQFDCRTCYCPFYEICSTKQDTTFGGYLLNEKVWACEKCEFIHQKKAVETIIELRKQNIAYEKIYAMLLKIYKEELSQSKN